MSAAPPPSPPTAPSDRPVSELATLVREYLLAGHLIDRAGMPQVIARWGREVMREVAIAEWMAASPVYTRRMQRLLGFDGVSDVATIFKGMQLDIGAPPQFMDFRYLVHDDHHGEFWLDSCGALLDVEPMGEEYVVTMCHHIEDPTFDATATATNPRARVRPRHRPPRVPADRHPHCHWTVVVDPAAEPLAEPAEARRLARTRAAALPLAAGCTDSYRGRLENDLDLEGFSAGTLEAICTEVALQGQLLVLGFAAALAARVGEDDAADVVAAQFAGIAGLTAQRLRRARGLGDSLADIASVLDVHPAFRPRRYVGLHVAGPQPADPAGGAEVLVRLDDAAGLHEAGAPGWPAVLARGDATALETAARAVNPTARVEAVDPPRGAVRAWRITLGETAAPEAPEVTLTRFSTGAEFEFRTR